jgi:Lrp/AsnC family transcriptional regulator, leucine-responsive regulatory protein
MTRHRIDSIDVDLIRLLQRDGRTRQADLAETVGLSVPSVSERLKKLEEKGILRGYRAIVDPHAVGLELTAFIFLTTSSSKHYPRIVELATKEESVLECHAVTGEGSHLLKVRTPNTQALERLLGDIQSWPGVVTTRTNVVLSSPKEEAPLPLGELEKQAVER